MNDVLDAAIGCAAVGFYVFPAPPGQRKSHKSAAFSRSRRRWGATNDPDEIAQDWQRWPEASLGIECGPDSDLLVIDIDGPSHGVDGFSEWAKLIREHGGIPETVEVETPSGGRHIYFRWPKGCNIANSASRIAPGIDVRGEGGMVIAPPSVKPGVGAYRWRASPEVGIAECPEWLVRLCMRPVVAAAPSPMPIAAPAEAWAQRALEAETAAVLAAPEGTRNDRLNTAAFNLGQIVAGGGLGQGAVQAHLERAATGAGLRGPEIAATIASGLRAGAASPRRPRETERPQLVSAAGRPVYAESAPAVRQADYDRPTLDMLAGAPPGAMPDVTAHAGGVLAETFAYVAEGMRRDWPEAAFVIALQVVGIVIGRNYETWTRLRSNLYTVALAESGFSKSSAVEPAKELLIQAGLQELIGAERIKSDSGLVQSIYASADKKKLFFLDEYGHMLQQCTARGAGGHVRQIIVEFTNLYSKANAYYAGAAYADGSRTWQMDCPHVNVLGMATPGQFWAAFGSGAIEDGTLARYSIVKPIGRPMRREPDPARLEAMRDALAPKLRALAERKVASGNLGEVVPVRVKAAPDAVTAWRAVGDTAEDIAIDAGEKMPDKDIGGILARVAETAAKLALILAVARNPDLPIIAEADIAAGRRLAWWFAHVAIEGAMTHIADSVHQANSQKVLAFIRAGEGGRRTRSDVTRKFRNLTPRELDDAVKSLTDSDMIALDMVPAGSSGGRPIAVYTALKG